MNYSIDFNRYLVKKLTICINQTNKMKVRLYNEATIKLSCIYFYGIAALISVSSKNNFMYKERCEYWCKIKGEK